MRNVGVVEPSAAAQFVERFAARGVDSNINSVDGIAGDRVAVNVRPDAVERIVEAVGVCGDRGERAVRDLGEGDRRPLIDNVNRGEDRGARAGHRTGCLVHRSAAEAEVGLVNGVEEEISAVSIIRIIVVHVRIVSEDETAPLRRRRTPRSSVRVSADRVVAIRRQEDRIVLGSRLLGCAEQLDGSVLPTDCGDVLVRARFDLGVLQFNDHAGVDHHRRPLRDVKRATVAQSIARTEIVRTDQIGGRVSFRVQVPVGPAISHDANDADRVEQTVGPGDVERDDIRQIDMVPGGHGRRQDAAALAGNRRRDCRGDLRRIADLASEITCGMGRRKRSQTALNGQSVGVHDRRDPHPLRSDLNRIADRKSSGTAKINACLSSRDGRLQHSHQHGAIREAVRRNCGCTEPTRCG